MSRFMEPSVGMRRPHRLFILFQSVVLAWAIPVYGQVLEEWKPSEGPPPSGSPEIEIVEETGAEVSMFVVEAVVVNPYRTVSVGAQVGGPVEKFPFEEGDFVEEGSMVVLIGSRRYELIAQRAQERMNLMEVASERAQEEARIKKEVYDHDGTTRQEVLKYQSEAEMAKIRIEESRKEFELATYDLESCKVTAPFSGYISAKNKQVGETTDRFEKIFTLVDSSKVHAIAHVPENLLPKIKRGMEATFVYSSDRKFKGVVDRIGKIIDPKSRTKKVYLLIDNANNELEIGMNGTLQFIR